jgi:Papain-like cysteine protease AvrRpt2
MSEVIYRIPLIPQDGPRTCWHAAAQMLVAFLRGRLVATTQVGLDQPAAALAVAEDYFSLLPQGACELARHNNLRMKFVSPTPEVLERLLLQFGPLWYGGRLEGYRGMTEKAHVVVITGLRREEKGDEITVNDPWPPGKGARLSFEYNDFFSTLTPVAGTPFLHI